MKRTNLDKSTPEYCVMGTVIQEVKTSNVAREVISMMTHNNSDVFDISPGIVKCRVF